MGDVIIKPVMSVAEMKRTKALPETERLEIIEQLKTIYGVTTERDVLKRALELALQSARYTDT